jgi:4'-phosphopantetheinyl transferase EntD
MLKNKSKKLSILWLGTIATPALESKYKAISPAANKWQYQFIRALIRNKISVLNYTCLLQSTWPRGNLFVSDKFELIQDFEQKYISLH